MNCFDCRPGGYYDLNPTLSCSDGKDLGEECRNECIHDPFVTSTGTYSSYTFPD